MAPAHHYRITVDMLQDTGEEGDARSISFYAVNPDDILAIVDNLRACHGYNASSAASLAVGLKLFTGVIFEHRNDPLFQPLHQPMHELVEQLKTPGRLQKQN